MSESNDSSSRHSLSHGQHRSSARRTTTQLYDHVHSTPIQHKTTSLRTSSSEPVPRHTRSPSSGRVRRNLNSTLSGCEAGSNCSMDSSAISLTKSLSRQARVAEFENATIQKQRQELHLLVAELRDRDRELNEMVSSHHKQLLSWDQDRQKILSLERMCSHLEQTLHERSDELRALTAKLNIAESSTQNQMTALDSTQRQLARVTEQHSQAESFIKELEEKNRSVNQALVSQASSVGQLEAHEHELRTVLKLKDRDLVEAANQITELCRKLKKFGAQYRESRLKETETKRKLVECKNKCSDSQYQLSVLQREQLARQQELDDNKLENQRLSQEIATLKQELLLFDEREKRKDQILALQKSKHERLESELSTLQQLYERQQQDLCLLHLNLESTKSLLDQQGALQHNKQLERSRNVEQNGELEQSRDSEPVRELEEKTDFELGKDRKRNEGLGEGDVEGRRKREEGGEIEDRGSNGVDERCNPGLGETVLPPYVRNGSPVDAPKTNTPPPATTGAPLQAEPYYSPGVATMPRPQTAENTCELREDHEGSRIPILLPRAKKSDSVVSGKQPRRNSPRHKSDSAVPSGGKMENPARQRRVVSRWEHPDSGASASSGENGRKDWDDHVNKEDPEDPKCLPVVPGLLGQGDIQSLNGSKTSTSEMSTLALSILYNSQSSAGGDTSHVSGVAIEKQSSKDGGSVDIDDDIMNERFPDMDYCSTPKKSNTSLEDADTSDIAEDVRSPVSKLHKLLTESCELVRDLERSVLSSSSAADEEETETLVDNEGTP